MFGFTDASICPTGPGDPCPPVSESSPEPQRPPEDKPQVWTQCPSLSPLILALEHVHAWVI